jgi:predicted MFS family arabinose efflux permease
MKTLSAAEADWTRSALFAVASAAAIVTLSMGVRQSFGLLLQPVGSELGISRESFGFAIAVQNLLFGLVQPFIGAASDRFGTRPTLIAGSLLYVAGLVLAASASGAESLGLALGLMVGMALSATTFVVVLSAVGRVVHASQRSLAFGLVTAGGSLGQFAVVPLAQGLIGFFDWRMALLLMSGLIALIVALAFGLPGRGARAGGAADVDGPELSHALQLAARHPHYWLLNGGFFVCGFHVAFVGTHLPAYLVDGGLAPAIGAWSLALIGLFNIAGSWLFGLWGGRHSRMGLLTALYAARGVAILLFLWLPLSNVSALLFAAVFGFLWLGTVPLTSGAVAAMFGLRQLSTLYGIVFLSHQVGAFFGAWWAGRLFDATGSYAAIWWTSVALAVLAAVLSALTREHRAWQPA